MGPKTIAIALVFLVGAVAAYDVKHVVNRKNKQHTTPGAAAPAEPQDVKAAGDAGAAPVDHNAAAQADPAPPAEKIQPADASTATPADPAPGPSAGSAAVATLPPIFQTGWTSPFTKTPELAPAAAGETVQKADAAGIAGGGFSQDYQPVISAVLLSGKAKRVVIDRQALSEGDVVPGIGATVKAITESGVELEVAGTTRFFRLGVGPAKASNVDQQ